MISVMIADDHPVVRQGIKRVLNRSGAYSVTAEAESLLEIRPALRTVPIDVLILDLCMPGGDGLTTLKEIKEEFSELPVIVFSFYEESHFGPRAFKGGASAFLSKGCDLEEMTKALTEVLNGKRYFGKVTQDLIYDQFKCAPNNMRPPHTELSNRELYVLMMLGKGKSLTDIAYELSLSIKTVSTYKQRILKKMKLKTNAQIFQYMVAQRLI